MSFVANLLRTPHTFAVVGVSQDPSKYGYELYEILTKHGHQVLAVNPKYATIDGQPCYSSIETLPKVPDAVITAVPPSVSVRIAETCIKFEIPIFWMPPTTDSEDAIELCKNSNV